MQKTGPVGCYFWLSNEPSVGSPIEMEIRIPAELVGQTTGTLLCQGKVVAVKKNDTVLGQSHTGVSCSIEQYRLIPEAADVATAEENA
jgi:hypothetical protein